MVTQPVPVVGAVHGIFTTYVVPLPPLPEVAKSVDECSTTVVPDAVAVWEPLGADNVPRLVVVPVLTTLSW
jgi:hypothetical protein